MENESTAYPAFRRSKLMCKTNCSLWRLNRGNRNADSSFSEIPECQPGVCTNVVFGACRSGSIKPELYCQRVEPIGPGSSQRFVGSPECPRRLRSRQGTRHVHRKGRAAFRCIRAV